MSETSGKVWCEHITTQDIAGSPWNFCPFCGTKRPKEANDELDEIVERNCSGPMIDIDSLKKDLRAWKEKDCGVLIKEVKEEKTKRLQEILENKDTETRYGLATVNYDQLAKAAIEAIEKAIDKISIQGCWIDSGVDSLKQKIREELL